jgi:aldehyde dehydrogenase (NAD+)
MKEEIFGPILPIITYETMDEVTKYISAHDKPLALYIFSKNKKSIKKILAETSSGGVVINHLIFHLANPYLPFGGVGASGIGSCHGFFGFRAFSHEKAVLSQGSFTLTTLFFPPYTNWLSKLVFKLLRFLE